MKRLCAFLLLLFVLSVPALAGTAEETVRGAVPEGAKEILSDQTLRGGLTDGLWAIVKNALAASGDGGLWGVLRRILGASLICGALCAFQGVLKSPALVRITQAAGGACVYLIAAGGSDALLSGASAAVREMTVFSETYTAVYTAACAAAGAPTAAAARSAVAVFASGMFGELCGKVLLPLCTLYAILRTAGACMGQPGLSRLAETGRAWAVTGLRWSLAIYSALITLSGAVGAASDSLLKRGVKTGVSAAVPIVGGALSEACEAIFAGAAAVRNTVGVMGILVLVATALAPLLRTGLWYVGLRAASSVCALMEQGGAAEVCGVMGDAMGLLLAITASVTAAELIAVLAGFLTFV